jgi:hypothetical protein
MAEAAAPAAGIGAVPAIVGGAVRLFPLSTSRRTAAAGGFSFQPDSVEGGTMWRTIKHLLFLAVGMAWLPAWALAVDMEDAKLDLILYQQRVLEMESIVDNLGKTAVLLLILTVLVVAAGAAAALLQSTARPWAKWSVAVLGAFVAVVTGLRPVMFDDDYQGLEAKLNEARTPLGSAEAAIRQFQLVLADQALDKVETVRGNLDKNIMDFAALKLAPNRVLALFVRLDSSGIAYAQDSKGGATQPAWITKAPESAKAYLFAVASDEYSSRDEAKIQAVARGRAEAQGIVEGHIRALAAQDKSLAGLSSEESGRIVRFVLRSGLISKDEYVAQEGGKYAVHILYEVAKKDIDNAARAVARARQ